MGGICFKFDYFCLCFFVIVIRCSGCGLVVIWDLVFCILYYKLVFCIGLFSLVFFILVFLVFCSLSWLVFFILIFGGFGRGRIIWRRGNII